MSIYEDEDEGEDFEKTSVVPSDTFKIRLAAAGEAPPCLVLLIGPSQHVGRQWPIESADVSLGRSPSNDICVEERSVSGSHAKLMMSAGEVSVVDMNSTNKTMVNSKIIVPMQPVKLSNNDQVQVGNVIFKFLEQGNLEAVSNAEAYDRAVTDSLTGIYNKGAFDSKAAELFGRANLLGANLSIVTFDIDHFKKVNDTHGHPAGDYVIKTLAHEVRDKLIRGNDYFARTGGEEFCILLLGNSPEQAFDVGERIRKTIEEKNFTFNNIHMPIRVSVGVASKKASDEKWNSIFDRADKALYESKKSGRNKVSASE